MTSHFNQVGNFHQKFGIHRRREGTGPTLIDDQVFLYRYQFLLEELSELLQSHRKQDLVEVADALVDLVYVALGTAHLYNIPFDAVFDAVHNANMKKERAVNADDDRSKRGHSLDIVKPEGWQPADLKPIIFSSVSNE